MFKGCTSLTSIPSLASITEVGYSGGYSMFEGCTSLTSVTIPNISDFNSSNAYYGFSCLFKGCTNLNNVTCLIENYDVNDNSDTFENWLEGVASTGTLKKKESTNFTYNNDGPNYYFIPDGWTVTNV